MEIGDVVVGFDDSVWGSWEGEENPLFKKSSSLTAMFKSIVGLERQYVPLSNKTSRQISKYSLPLADGGTWVTSIGGGKDPQGNSSASVEASIGQRTESGANYSASGGASISSDKNQNIQGDAHGSFSIGKTTESGLSTSANIEGSISRDRNQNVQTEIRVNLEVKGTF